MKTAPARSAPARLLRAVFPFSLRGLLFFALAAAVLCLGIARADMAALFWGASFLLVELYFLAAAHVCRLTLRRRRDTVPGFASVTLPSKGLQPGEEGEASLTTDLPRAFLPGIVVRFRLPLVWHDRALSGLEAGVPPGPGRRTIGFNAGLRGTYRSTHALLEAGDVLGFTRAPLAIELSESVSVLPPLDRGGQAVRILEEGGDTSVPTRRRRRSEELLEARKYYPGDDVRRLNWKVFAHLSELFLRIGEEAPPPESHLLLVLDCTENPGIPSRLAGGYLDGLVESCAATLAGLLRQRVDAMLSWPGERGLRSYSEESLAEALAAFADIWWTGQPWNPETAGRRHLHAVVFSSPGSPGLRGIMGEIARRGWSASLFLKGLGEPFTAAPLGLRSLFLVPSQPLGSARAFPTRREAAESAEAIGRDLSAYGAAPWKVRHAGTI